MTSAHPDDQMRTIRSCGEHGWCRIGRGRGPGMMGLSTEWLDSDRP